MHNKYAVIHHCNLKRFEEILNRLRPTPPLSEVVVRFNVNDAARLSQACISSGLTPEQIVRDMLLDFAEFGSYKIPKGVPEPTTKALKNLLISKTK